MMKWIRRLREFVVIVLLAVAWMFFLILAKIKWIFRGPRVLPVSIPEMTCTPDPAWLERAQEAALDTFFENRMSNRRRKIIGANWEVLYEDKDTVYYGRPHTVFGAGGLFRSAEFGVDLWFRVPRSTLISRFPGYAVVDGRSLREEMEAVFQQYPKYVELRNQWVGQLDDDAVVVCGKADVEEVNTLRLRFSLTDGRWLGEGPNA